MTRLPVPPLPGLAALQSPVAARRVLRSVETVAELWQATANGFTDYWVGAIERGATPADVLSDSAAWWKIVTERGRPTWSTPNEVVLSTDIMNLRDFSQGSTDHVVPSLVLPPQAGHDSCIVDYSPDQSQIKVMRAAGLTKVYVLEWLGATEATKDTTIADYLEILERSVEHIVGPDGTINLVGDCQGGWLATIYAALHPERVNTLTIAGAPIDFRAGEGPIEEYVDLFTGNRDMTFYRSLVAAGDGVMKGENMLAGFIVMKPENELDKQLGLLSHLDDPKHLERYRVFEDWFKHTQDIPGAFYLWIVEKLFRDNQMVRGELEVDGRRVDLAEISCPLMLLGGETDHITPPLQVFALADAASTPPEQVTRRVSTGGHLGLFMGREALAEHWPPILAEVFEHSRTEDTDQEATHRRVAASVPENRDPIPAP